MLKRHAIITLKTFILKAYAEQNSKYKVSLEGKKCIRRQRLAYVGLIKKRNLKREKMMEKFQRDKMR